MVGIFSRTIFHSFSIMIIMNISFYSLDINECTINVDGCGTNAVCTNTIGSFICTCISGFTGSGVSCSGKLMSYRCV